MTVESKRRVSSAVVIAWLITAVYYFYQYSMRSSPAVMMPQIGSGLGLDAAGVASLVGLFYYGYAPFALVAGVTMDQFGPRRVIPIGAAAVGIGALLFASGSPALAAGGRLLQGAGGVFGLIGAAYIASTYFPASSAATLIGATQMFGMAGGSAGQFVVGPMIASGLAWDHFWAGMGAAGLAMSVMLFALLPRSETVGRNPAWMREAARSLAVVFRNPQSLLCGAISGLLFLPTTIFDMVWGVRYLQDAHGLGYAEAVLRSSTVPFGWMIGCPLLGFVSDRIGRRKPVIAASAVLLLACLAWILHGPTQVLPPYMLGIATGIASGGAMLPYTVIKEANPANVSGTATGVVSFLNFTLSALVGPVFARRLASAAGGATSFELAHFQSAFEPLLFGIAAAALLALALKETGSVAANAAGGRA